MAATKASQTHLTPENLGLARIDASPSGSIEAVNGFLQENHEKYHMHFRKVAGHSHIPHSVLMVLAMGGGPKELKRAYDDGEIIQQPLPPADQQIIKDLKSPEDLKAAMLQLDQYTNLLYFFEQEIEDKGDWRAVVTEYCFSRTSLAEAMLSQLYDGLFHPMIHLGFGIE